MEYHVPRITLEIASVTVVLGTLASYLPAISAALACVYYGMQIYRMTNRRPR